MPPKPLVAIVGRPNVGKSTLFNRLIGQRRSIVEDVPGTTRDRLYGDVEWAGRTFTLIDTGGLELAPTTSIMTGVAAQVGVAAEEADLILFAVDSVDGLTGADEEIAQLLRRGGLGGSGDGAQAMQGRQARKPVIVVAGKADNQARRDAANEFYALGFERVIAVSAYHGANVGDLLDEIVELLADAPQVEDEEDDDRLRIAIVGRPNVGKSSLLNKLLGQDRVVVSEIPGTTRDSIDTEIEHHPPGEGVPARRILLIDTAGIRRRGKVEPGIEKYSVLRSLRAVERAHVAVLMVDATEMVTAQDLHIAGEIEEDGKGVVLVVNKWDLVEKDTHTIERYMDEIGREFNFMRWVPVVFISALTGQRVRRVIDEAIAVDTERKKRIPTSQLNDMLERALASRPPTMRRGKPVKVYYATQVDVTPPTFLFFVNDPELIHFALTRYLDNTLREAFGFRGSPIRLRFRKRNEEKEEKRRGA